MKCISEITFTIMENIVWVRDSQEGFILAKMTELMDEGSEIIPLNPKYKNRICSFEDIYPSGDYEKEFDDSCKFFIYNSILIFNSRVFFKTSHQIYF